MTLVRPFSDPDAQLEEVGGKGKNLGRMATAGFPVPPGFTLTTAAYRDFITSTGVDLAPLLEVQAGDTAAARREGERVRTALTAAALPDDVARAAVDAWRELGEDGAYAVRSSATLEDLPEASFAGQQDTFLNVRGEEALLHAVRACFASLFTDRAILYRRQHAFDDRDAALAVVVQRMVRPDKSGILFTADPVSQHRGVSSIDASWGLGEALVSGKVNADVYRVPRAGGPIDVRVGDKGLAIWPLPDGGTEEREVEPERRKARVLDDDEVARLVKLGDDVERAQGSPQDIEWAIEGDELYLLQTRAITSLYPLVEPATDDDGLHVFVSVGHLQVMTAAMRPFGSDFLSYLFPFGKERPRDKSQVLLTAGGRPFADFTPALRTFPFSVVFPRVLRAIDAGVSACLEPVRARVKHGPGPRARRGFLFRLIFRPLIAAVVRALRRRDPENALRDVEAECGAAVEEARANIRAAPDEGEALYRTVEQLFAVFPLLFARVPPLIIVGSLSWHRLGKLAPSGMGTDVVQELTRGLRGNVTTEMDLELGDLADAARAVPGFVEAIAAGDPSTVLEEQRGFAGADGFYELWDGFLERYGFRCPGEIDASQPRWRDDPSSLVQSIVGMSRGEREPGAHRAHQTRAAARAAEIEQELVARAPFWRRARIKKLVRRARSYLPVREHAKYYLMQMVGDAHAAAKRVGERAASEGRLERDDDVWFLHVAEVATLARGELPGDEARTLVAQRRAEHARDQKRRPPRVVTSEGEVPAPKVTRELPPGSFGGLAVSAGVVEGTARVVLDPNREVLHDGEILVAPFTDPGWTPLFVHAAGVVLEVGGLMTHGSVVAREYGIPAVAAVDEATTKIRTGQRVRVDGTAGIVTLLDDD